MKVKDFIKEVEDYLDFDLVIEYLEKDDSEYGISLVQFKVDGIADIGYSSKVINISIKESS